MNHKMSLLPLQYISYLHGLFGNKSLYLLHDNNFLNCNVVKQLQFTRLVLLFVLTLLSYEVVQPLHVEKSAVERSRETELDDKRKSVRLPATSADAVLSLEDHRPLAYIPDPPRLSNVVSCFVTKKTRRRQ